MRDWILRRVNGVCMKQHTRLYLQYLDLLTEQREMIEKYEMQSAWEQTKQERKLRRLN
jgi:hypothetical protein